jgi:hypothetical protein
MAKVRKHSRIDDELPAEVRGQVDRLLIEGGATYDDIRDFLAEQGYDISRSAIGRYGKDFLNTYQRLRVAEDQARSLVSEVGDGLALDEAASKLLMQQVLELLISTELTPKERMSLMKSVAFLQSSSVQREKLKSELRKKAETAVGEVAQIAKNGGLSDEAIRQIEEQVLGIVR